MILHKLVICKADTVLNKWTTGFKTLIESDIELEFDLTKKVGK